MSSLIQRKTPRSKSTVSLVGSSTSSLIVPVSPGNERSMFPVEEDVSDTCDSLPDVHSSSPRSAGHRNGGHLFKKRASMDFHQFLPSGGSKTAPRKWSLMDAKKPPMVGDGGRKPSFMGFSPPKWRRASTTPTPPKRENEFSNLIKSLKPSHYFEKTSSEAFHWGWLSNITPYIMKLLEWATVMVLLYFEFNVAYIFLFFLLYVYQIHSSESVRKLALYGRIPTEMFLSLIDKESFPSWLKTSDMDRVEWINEMISQMWPNLSRYATHFIKTFIEPELVEMLAELQLKELSNLEIKKVLLGTIPMKVGGVRVFPRGGRSEKEGIIMEMEIFYSGDARVQFVVQHIAAEIKHINLRGVMRINLKPLLNTFPLIGGMEVTFMQAPIYSYSMGGIGTFADLPGISTLVKSVVDSQIKARVIWPNKLKIVLPLIESEEILRAQKSDISRPFGFLSVRILEGENLVAKDLGGTSDPYAVVMVNGEKINFQSQYVAKTLNPVWDYSCDFILQGDLLPEDHACEIQIYDYDQGTHDDFMGNVLVDLSGVFQSQEDWCDHWMPLSNVKRGKVRLKMKFRECSPVLAQSGDYIIHVFVESCVNLQSEVGGPLTGLVKCTVNDKYVLNQRGKTTHSDGTHHIDDSVTFLTSIEEELSLIVSDKRASSKVCGDYRLSISDLVNNFDGNISNEAIPLNFHSDSKMVVSIRLFSLDN